MSTSEQAYLLDTSSTCLSRAETLRSRLTEAHLDAEDFFKASHLLSHEMYWRGRLDAYDFVLDLVDRILEGPGIPFQPAESDPDLAHLDIG